LKLNDHFPAVAERKISTNLSNIRQCEAWKPYSSIAPSIFFPQWKGKQRLDDKISLLDSFTQDLS